MGPTFHQKYLKPHQKLIAPTIDHGDEAQQVRNQIKNRKVGERLRHVRVVPTVRHGVMSGYHMTNKWCINVQSGASWSTEVLDGVPIASSRTGVERMRSGGVENRAVAPNKIDLRANPGDTIRSPKSF